MRCVALASVNVGVLTYVRTLLFEGAPPFHLTQFFAWASKIPKFDAIYWPLFLLNTCLHCETFCPSLSVDRWMDDDDEIVVYSDLSKQLTSYEEQDDGEFIFNFRQVFVSFLQSETKSVIEETKCFFLSGNRLIIRSRCFLIFVLIS